MSCTLCQISLALEIKLISIICFSIASSHFYPTGLGLTNLVVGRSVGPPYLYYLLCWASRWRVTKKPMQPVSFTCKMRMKLGLAGCLILWWWYNVLSAAIASLFTSFQVMTRCSDQRIQRATRKLFQRIQKIGRLFTVPRCLYVNSNEMGGSSIVHDTGGFAQVLKSQYRGNPVAVKYLKHELDDKHRRVTYHVFAKEYTLIYSSASFTKFCCGRVSSTRGYCHCLVSLIMAN